MSASCINGGFHLAEKWKLFNGDTRMDGVENIAKAEENLWKVANALCVWNTVTKKPYSALLAKLRL